MTFNRIRLGMACLALLTLAICLGPISASAQSTTQGSIAGTVQDQSGAVVGDAVIVIHNTGTNSEVRLTSDSSGFFKASLLEPGTYSVTVTAPAFAAYRAASVTVQVGQVTSLAPHLAIASSSAEVIVTDQTPAMNLESPDFAETLSQQQIQNIPVNNRRWSALAMTTPGVVADSSGFGLVSIRGISTVLNNVEIDGADDNNAYYSEERGRTRQSGETPQRDFAPAVSSPP